MSSMAQYLPMAVRTRRVIVIVFPGVQTLDATGPAEVFAGAARRSGRPLYEVVLASAAGGLVRTSAGFAVETTALAELAPGKRDTVLVAGGDEAAIRAALAEPRIA